MDIKTPKPRFKRGFEYPERDLNPHSRNGHRILSPACLPVPPSGQNGWLFKLKKFKAYLL